MHRLSATIIGVCVAVGLVGCGTGSLAPVPVHAACQGHPDPGDCHAALETAMSETGVSLDGYAITVATIDCEDGTCTTWVSAVPTGDDCVPSWDVEVSRPLIGSWGVSMLTHGDPPCAFEP